MTAPAPGRLQNRIAIITGASSSIGRAISLAYASEGATIIVADVRPTSRAETESVPTHELIAQQGGKASFMPVDVTDSAGVDKLVEDVVKAHGRLDIMVNNAGIAPEVSAPQPIYALLDKTWHSTLAVNGTGIMHCMRAAARQMIAQAPLEEADGARGWIISIASVFGLVGSGSAPSYTASKHLTLGLTKSAALDLAPHSIHVNAICPGFIDTALISEIWSDEPRADAPAPESTGMPPSGAERRAMISSMHPFGAPEGRLGTPQDVAGVAVFLASKDAKWVTGSGVVVDGGFTAR